MPTRAAGRCLPSSCARSAAIASSACGEPVVGDDAVEAEAVGVRRGADVEAEALLDPFALAERELGAAAAGVEDDERPSADVELGRRGAVGEPRLLLAGDHLDADTAALAHHLDQLGGVLGLAHPRGRDRGDLGDAGGARLLDHADDRVGGSPQRLRLQRARLLQPLAEPGHLGAVEDRAPGVPGVALADVELDGVRADVDHREADGIEPEHRLEPSCEADVRPVGELQLADGCDHERGILRLDGDRARRPMCGRDLRQLGHAAARTRSGHAACARRRL